VRRSRASPAPAALPPSYDEGGGNPSRPGEDCGGCPDDALRALVPIVGAAPEGDAAALRAWLRAEVARMLTGERARLMAILYRVDVRERDLAAALMADDVPGALADALIARMAEKLRYRRAAL
jgi:hypothetical protein